MAKYTITITYGWLSLLGLLFIVLKLFKVVEWDWIWVLAPIWMPLAAGFIFILIIALVVISQRRKRLGIDD